MQFNIDTLKKDEQTALMLRALYESYGYKKFKTGRFEEYGLYLENKSFLKSENLITFNDLNGRLLALKPDVTLSIVKNTNAKNTAEKLYYVENVYRYNKQSGEFKEINQTGLELIGDVDLYGTAEVIRLALQSLNTIDGDFILDISHMGFVTGLIDTLTNDAALKQRLIELIRAKNTHDLKKIAGEAHGGRGAVGDANAARATGAGNLGGIGGGLKLAAEAVAGLTSSAADKLIGLTELSGGLGQALERARDLITNAEMQSAYDELLALSQKLKADGLAKNIRLDFSIVNDISYYNGIIFHGYVKKAPAPVLSGGRYDRLMERLKKKGGAIGFAVYLNELRPYNADSRFAVDTLLLYGDKTDAEVVLNEAERLVKNGQRVRVEKHIPKDVGYKNLIRL
jgi:ATP phosphoribosyltransferase regulatory subunit